MKVDVLIIGAGAAGLMCAIAAGQRGRRVLVVALTTPRGRQEILMSGGGRCNFTNTGAAANYLSANPHFAKSALARYTPLDFIALVAVVAAGISTLRSLERPPLETLRDL